MKKTFITILSFLYLMSGIGYGSMQHYCQIEQKMMPLGENQCCSGESATELSTACQIPDEPQPNSCCAMIDTSVPADDCETTLPDDCCEIQHTYNQLDSSSLPQNIEVSQAAISSDELYYYYPQHPQNIDECVLTTFTNPSTHFNIPLLI